MINHLPSRLLATIPPPESPWQVSVPPLPAHNCLSLNLTPYKEKEDYDCDNDAVDDDDDGDDDDDDDDNNKEDNDDDLLQWIIVSSFYCDLWSPSVELDSRTKYWHIGKNRWFYERPHSFKMIPWPLQFKIWASASCRRERPPCRILLLPHVRLTHLIRFM